MAEREPRPQNEPLPPRQLYASMQRFLKEGYPEEAGHLNLLVLSGETTQTVLPEVQFKTSMEKDTTPAENFTIVPTTAADAKRIVTIISDPNRNSASLTGWTDNTLPRIQKRREVIYRMLGATSPQESGEETNTPTFVDGYELVEITNKSHTRLILQKTPPSKK